MLQLIYLKELISKSVLGQNLIIGVLFGNLRTITNLKKGIIADINDVPSDNKICGSDVGRELHRGLQKM
jgi:hypothetical protein